MGPNIYDAAVSLRLRHTINCGAGGFASLVISGAAFKWLPTPYDEIAGSAALVSVGYALLMLCIGYHRTLPKPEKG